MAEDDDGIIVHQGIVNFPDSSPAILRFREVDFDVFLLRLLRYTRHSYTVHCLEQNMRYVMRKPSVILRTGPTQTKLYKYRRWLEAGNFGFRKYLGIVLSVYYGKQK